MATVPVKSPLHNFPLPFLGWGGGSGGGGSSSRCRRPTAGDGSAEADAPNRAGSRRNRLAPCSAEKPKESGNGNNNNDEAEAKPWNLRPRKALFAKAAKEPQEPEAAGISGENARENINRLVHVEQQMKSMRLRANWEAPQQQQQNPGSETAPELKRKLWVALSREEIEEDLFILTGSRPSRRPRKRPKNVQKQFDAMSPGFWLVGYSADAYRVTEAAPKVKGLFVNGDS